MPINFKEAILFIWFYSSISNRCSLSGTLGQRTGPSFIISAGKILECILVSGTFFGSLGNKLCNGGPPQLPLGWTVLAFYTRAYPETFPELRKS